MLRHCRFYFSLHAVATSTARLGIDRPDAFSDAAAMRIMLCYAIY